MNLIDKILDLFPAQSETWNDSLKPLLKDVISSLESNGFEVSCPASAKNMSDSVDKIVNPKVAAVFTGVSDYARASVKICFDLSDKKEVNKSLNKFFYDESYDSKVDTVFSHKKYAILTIAVQSEQHDYHYIDEKWFKSHNDIPSGDLSKAKSYLSEKLAYKPMSSDYKKIEPYMGQDYWKLYKMISRLKNLNNSERSKIINQRAAAVYLFCKDSKNSESYYLPRRAEPSIEDKWKSLIELWKAADEIDGKDLPENEYSNIQKALIQLDEEGSLS
jgi:hypothetical protein